MLAVETSNPCTTFPVRITPCLTRRSSSFVKPSRVERWGGSLAGKPSCKVLSTARTILFRACGVGEGRACACVAGTNITAVKRKTAAAANRLEQSPKNFDTPPPNPSLDLLFLVSLGSLGLYIQTHGDLARGSTLAQDGNHLAGVSRLTSRRSSSPGTAN